MTYQIGYRRPPTSAQFKAGTSGNPKGRPKGAKNFITLLEKELAKKIVVTEAGKKKSVTRLEAMVKRIVTGALQGDHKALLTLLEVLRRSGQFQPPETGDLLPENYASILDAYVEARSRSTRPTRSEDTR
jgi:hypothetical protein